MTLQGTNDPNCYTHNLWFGDLCDQCRQALAGWLKPIPKGPKEGA